MRGALIRRTRHWIANRGLRKTLAEFLRQVLPLLRELRPDFRRGRKAASLRPAVHPFDVQYGLDTSGLIWGESLASDDPSQYWATGYYGISPSVFCQPLDQMNLDWSKFTFIDVGSGKGRALALAQRYPFRHIVGVELSGDLTRICIENLKHFAPEWQLCSSVEVIESDVTAFSFPHQPLILFLYHPFARPVMVQFVENLRSSLQEHPRLVYLIYANPELNDLLAGSGFLVQLWHESFAMQPEDFTADFFGLPHEHIAVYRSL